MVTVHLAIDDVLLVPGSIPQHESTKIRLVLQFLFKRNNFAKFLRRLWIKVSTSDWATNALKNEKLKQWVISLCLNQHKDRAVASWGPRGAAAPPGPVEPDASSLWMDLFCLDSVILIICNYLPFWYSRSIFRRHISWQVLKIEFRSLQIWKFSRGRYPHIPLQGSSLTIMPPPSPPEILQKK